MPIKYKIVDGSVVVSQGAVASLLDPETRRLRILELLDGRYLETASIGPGEKLTVDKPCRAVITLAG